MAEPQPYGTLPVISKVAIIGDEVRFWFADSGGCSVLSQEFGPHTPTGIWLRHLEEQLLLDVLRMHHGYGCELDGTEMTGPCTVCEVAQENFK